MRVRKCPKCNKNIEYKTQHGFENAIENNSLCRRCINLEISKNKNVIFFRKCPECSEEIIYNNEKKYLNSVEKCTLCKVCELIKIKKRTRDKLKRNCPTCDRELSYTDRRNYDNAIKNNSSCKECSNKLQKIESGEKIILFKCFCSKCNSPIIYREKLLYEKALENNAICIECAKNIVENSIGFSRLCKGCNGKINHKSKRLFVRGLMGNAKCKSCIAKERMNNVENKKLQDHPNWGWGWSGKYRNYSFRSLLELHYIIYLLENDIKFESAEKLKYSVEYIISNEKKRYYPDFYLFNSREIIEVKPEKHLKEDEVVKTKVIYATRKYNDKYRVVTEKDIPKAHEDILIEEYKNGNLIFNGKYDEKFCKKYLT